MANIPPVADDQTLSTEEDTFIDITLTGSDIDGDSLSFNVVTPPNHGSLSGTAPNLRYTPDQDFNGDDSFSFTASDGKSNSLEAEISITVMPVNDAPVALGQVFELSEDGSLSFTLLASDVDNDPLTCNNTNKSWSWLA